MRVDESGSMTTELPSSLRLLQVAPLPPPWSGIGVSVQHLLTSTPISRQATWLLNSSSGALPGDSRRPKTPTLRRIVRHARLTLELMRTVRQHRIHVVHLHGSSHDLSFIANGLTVIGARLTGARVVWQLHQDLAVVEFPGTTPLSRAVFASLMLAPHALVVLTEKDRTIATRFVDQTKVAVIPPACSTDMLSIPLKRPDRNFRVLYVGWLTQAKGIYDLLQVAQSVQQHLPQITFSILGTGSSNEETDRVRGLVERCGLKSHVNLCGVVTGCSLTPMSSSHQHTETPFPLLCWKQWRLDCPSLGRTLEVYRSWLIIDVVGSSRRSATSAKWATISSNWPTIRACVSIWVRLTASAFGENIIPTGSGKWRSSCIRN